MQIYQIEINRAIARKHIDIGNKLCVFINAPIKVNRLNIIHIIENNKQFADAAWALNNDKHSLT